jgi:hypothetical protein
MGHTEHWCRACASAHGAAFWYYQNTAPQGRWYVCGEQYNSLGDKVGWRPLDSDDPEEVQLRSSQIRYCKHCDGPLGGLREFEQGFHDRCAPKTPKTRSVNARRSSGARRGRAR